MIDNMILIFAVDENWNIGYDGDMLYKISEDLKRFRMLTTGNIIIMGRRTFESLPDRKALPDRINIVITSDKEYEAEDAYIVHSIDQLFSLLNEINPNDEMDNYMIGGGNLARQLMQNCNRAYITKLFKSFELADTFIPNLDLDDDWKVVKESDVYKQDDIYYRYVDYERIK